MIDINTTPKEDFTAQMRRLPPGVAMRTTDDIIVRRCRDHPGYEFVSHMGSPDPRRFTSVDSVIDAIYDRSARSIHVEAYGGAIRYKSYADAQKALSDGRAISGKHFDQGQMSQAQADRVMKRVTDREPVEPGVIKQDPQVNGSLRKLAEGASKGAYRSRARLASTALQNNDVAGARTHLETLISHAERNDADDDATAATEALVMLRNAYPDLTSRPSTVEVKAFRIRKTDEGFQIMRANGQKHGTAFANSRDANSRLEFLNKRATRQAAADEIDRQEKGEIVVREKVKKALGSERGETVVREKQVTDTRDWAA
jgi:hypothetical protein